MYIVIIYFLFLCFGNKAEADSMSIYTPSKIHISNKENIPVKKVQEKTSNTSVGNVNYIQDAADSSIEMLILAMKKYKAGTITKDQFIEVAMAVGGMSDYSKKVNQGTQNTNLLSKTEESKAKNNESLKNISGSVVATYIPSGDSKVNYIKCPSYEGYTLVNTGGISTGEDICVPRKDPVIKINATTDKCTAGYNRTFIDGNHYCEPQLQQLAEGIYQCSSNGYVPTLMANGQWDCATPSGKLIPNSVTTCSTAPQSSECLQPKISQTEIKKLVSDIVKSGGYSDENIEKIKTISIQKGITVGEIDAAMGFSNGVTLEAFIKTSPAVEKRKNIIKDYMAQFNGNYSADNIATIKTVAVSQGYSPSEIDTAMGFSAGTTASAFASLNKPVAPTPIPAPIVAPPAAPVVERKQIIQTYMAQFNGNYSAENIAKTKADAAAQGISPNEIDAAMGFPSGTTADAFSKSK